MHIWVDADACPAVIKEILFRAAERMELPLTLVANKTLRVPPSRFIRSMQVARGLDAADDEIARRLAPGDLVVTADIPLAAIVIERGGHAMNPRGELYTPDNIRERLALRDFLDVQRGAGEQTGGPAPFDLTDRKRCAGSITITGEYVATGHRSLVTGHASRERRSPGVRSLPARCKPAPKSLPTGRRR